MSEVFTVTEKAVEMVKRVMDGEGKDGQALRVTVHPGGCAGFTYGLDFADGPTDNDLVVHSNGIEVLVDQDIEEFIRGSTLDFVESLQGAGFVLDNPNASNSCGCGKSFS